MGDLTKEPSMEEILSSIKRIIAEEDDGEAPATARAPRRAAAADSAEEEPVLELTHSLPDTVADAGDEADMAGSKEYLEAIEAAAQSASGRPKQAGAAGAARNAGGAQAPADAAGDAILSSATEQAARSSLAALSSVLARPQVETDAAPAVSGQTLDALVAALLRPMLKDWLDAHLPGMVEQMVAQEISRITGQQG